MSQYYIAREDFAPEDLFVIEDVGKQIEKQYGINKLVFTHMTINIDNKEVRVWFTEMSTNEVHWFKLNEMYSEVIIEKLSEENLLTVEAE